MSSSWFDLLWELPLLQVFLCFANIYQDCKLHFHVLFYYSLVHNVIAAINLSHCFSVGFETLRFVFLFVHYTFQIKFVVLIIVCYVVFENYNAVIENYYAVHPVRKM